MTTSKAHAQWLLGRGPIQHQEETVERVTALVARLVADGRIAAFGFDHRNTLLFSGFQAAGTRGRKLLDGARETKIHGQWVPVDAEVVELPMLPAHAVGDELMRWLSRLHRAPQQVFIVHGEAQASEALRERIGHDLGWPATVPRQEQEFSL